MVVLVLSLDPSGGPRGLEFVGPGRNIVTGREITRRLLELPGDRGRNETGAREGRRGGEVRFAFVFAPSDVDGGVDLGEATVGVGPQLVREHAVGDVHEQPVSVEQHHRTASAGRLGDIGCRRETLKRVVVELERERGAAGDRYRSVAPHRPGAHEREQLIESLMLEPEQQTEVRKILDEARRALESGSASECTAALEKIAEMGRILSEVILYDPGAYNTADQTEVDPSGEA